MSKQYVQHISGQGEKWEVSKACEDYFVTTKYMNDGNMMRLPKSEYDLCDPPEEWRDVTEECEVTEMGWIIHRDRYTTGYNGYRRRKVQLCDEAHALSCAIIIEQKVTQ